MRRLILLATFLLPVLWLAPVEALAVPAPAGASGTAAEAKAMLERAVAALKANQADALDKFQAGRAGFKDRDLYVFCIGPDQLWSAHPSLKGQHVKTWITRDGRVVGEEMLKTAREGTVSETTYPWVRPGAMVPVPKTTYFTRVGDQVCGVGFLK